MHIEGFFAKTLIPSAQQSLFEAGCLHRAGTLQSGSQQGGGHTGLHSGWHSALAGAQAGAQAGGQGLSHTGLSSQHLLSEHPVEKSAANPNDRTATNVPNLFIVLYSLRLVKKQNIILSLRNTLRKDAPSGTTQAGVLEVNPITYSATCNYGFSASSRPFYEG
jgi:hypothetical protein